MNEAQARYIRNTNFNLSKLGRTISDKGCTLHSMCVSQIQHTDAHHLTETVFKDMLDTAKEIQATIEGILDNMPK